ncbi:hypothetical protein LSH36_281g10003 [Paralvinella palmiformis]|uniref:ETS domain-containing protein n=1 Tax=Paralvinella palmiformis TaxID=53620 RepID=A0AAD9JJP6_9ANNE|nr:hypothetical protein LSH36_281g10003 [Paralvinella palmiformis]
MRWFSLSYWFTSVFTFPCLGVFIHMYVISVTEQLFMGSCTKFNPGVFSAFQIRVSSLTMPANSPTHRVPDHELLLGGMPEETFYNEVFSGPITRAEQMDTSDSDCTSESDDSKVYMPLRKLSSRGGSISEKLIPVGECRAASGVKSKSKRNNRRVNDVASPWAKADPLNYSIPGQINVHSWKTRHPKNWFPQDITNWIYYICSQTKHMDKYKIRAENFNDLKGEQLCTMSLDEFINREPNYGRELYCCLQSLLKPANYKPPNDYIEILQMDELGSSLECNDSTMWSSAAMLPDQADPEMPLGRPVDLDFDSLGAGVAFIGDKKYDILCNDTFDDMPLFVESGYESGDSGSNSTLSDSFTSSIHNMQGSTCDMSSLTGQIYSGQGQAVMAPSSAMYNGEQSHPDTEHNVKQRGRPKHGSHTPGQRGRRPGQSTKGNHLWKFIRDVINDSRYNPEVIRWEDKEQGIFRIVNSAEIARMWGRKKNNTTMTYEKFSRAMRDYYKSDILRRVGSRKLVYGFGTKVFPHLVCYHSYMWPPMMGIRQTC